MLRDLASAEMNASRAVDYKPERRRVGKKRVFDNLQALYRLQMEKIERRNSNQQPVFQQWETRIRRASKQSRGLVNAKLWVASQFNP